MNQYASNYIDAISTGLKSTIATGDSNVSDIENALKLWVEIAKKVRDRRGLFFFIGNGASASMAEHMAHDCFKNADMLTQTCSETSHLTAMANDMSAEDIFSYKIEKILTEGDMLIAISSSGNSPNIIKAIKAAKTNGAFVVTLTGKSEDNMVRTLGDLNLYVPLDTYGLVESAHATLLHCWLDMFGNLHFRPDGHC